MIIFHESWQAVDKWTKLNKIHFREKGKDCDIIFIICQTKKNTWIILRKKIRKRITLLEIYINLGWV